MALACAIAGCSTGRRARRQLADSEAALQAAVSQRQAAEEARLGLEERLQDAHAVNSSLKKEVGGLVAEVAAIFEDKERLILKLGRAQQRLLKAKERLAGAKIKESENLFD